ncbi:MAG TPA: 50S ribosomal protein L29 [bacterium]|nr:50S ribosomal protein L29 [bacterium]
MKPTEMRQLSVEELGGRVTAWQEELFRMRCSQAIGQTTNSSAIRAMRRQIACAKTIINEIQAHAASQG